MNYGSCLAIINLNERQQMSTQSLAITGKTGHRVCSWWQAYLFDNPLRRMIHPAERVLSPYIAEGMVVLDFGCGFGHYALGMARLTGAAGQVVAVDVQQKMLDRTMARARKAGLDEIIRPLCCDSRRIGLHLQLDFALASNSIHETPDPAASMTELFNLLKPGGRLLLLEPRGHLKTKEFESEVSVAKAIGFTEEDSPEITRQMCVLLQKPEI